MSNKKKDAVFSNWPNQVGQNFEEEDEVLNYRPQITYEMPISLETESRVQPASTTLTDARQRTQDLVAAYNTISKLAEVAQERIDARVGDYKIQLDEKADFHVMEAIGRAFPDKDNVKTITYDMYKQCLAKLHAAQPASKMPIVTAADMAAAASDPKKTSFGGLGVTAGNNRKEVEATQMGGLQPLDMKKFQDSIVKKLFKLLQPMTKGDDAGAIAKHKMDTPHG